MFTGLIETIGTITRVTPSGNYRRFTIAHESLFTDLAQGESMAVSGSCLTVINFDDRSFTVEASQETLSLTTLGGVQPGRRVNLERARPAHGRLGGHIVSGHVDAALAVRRVRTIGRSLRVDIDLPVAWFRYVVGRGSVALDGISLTVTEVDRDSFAVNLIPETQKRTSWGKIKAGELVNVEFDVMGKYIVRFLELQAQGGSLTIEALRDMGY